MINLIASLRKRLKAVSLSAWLVCALIVLIGGWLIAVITQPPSAEQLQRNAEHEYYQRYNKFLPDEKTPEYDYKLYSMIKRDGRYFLVPRSYSGVFGFSFFWPKELESFYRFTVSKDEDFNRKRNLAAVLVFIESKRFRNGHINLAKIAKGAEACVPESENNQVFLWNGLIVWFRFDDIHLADWPKICQEALRILDQVKEVKV
jgi:hypothetical protein